MTRLQFDFRIFTALRQIGFLANLLVLFVFSMMLGGIPSYAKDNRPDRFQIFSPSKVPHFSIPGWKFDLVSVAVSELKKKI